MNKLREKFMQQKAIVDDFERLKKEVERLDGKPVFFFFIL